MGRYRRNLGDNWTMKKEPGDSENNETEVRSEEKFSNMWGLTFNDEKIIVPVELRKKLMESLHFDHAGTNKKLAEGRIFWWPNISKELKDRTKSCVAASGKI